jgi:hypothetical protein
MIEFGPGICRHIKSNGRRCGSPALKGRAWCFYHGKRRATARGRAPNPPQPIAFPPGLVDPCPQPNSPAVQAALTAVARGIAVNRIDPAHAATLLYGLQLVSANIKKFTQPAPANSRPISRQ